MTKINRWKRVQKKRKKVKRMVRACSGAPLKAGGEQNQTASDIPASESVQTEPRAGRKKAVRVTSWRQFGFDEPILNGVRKAGYERPTRIQAETLAHSLRGADVLATSETGSGKTAAFVLPLLQRLKSHDGEKGIRALVLSPTRELAMQTLNFLKQLGHYTNLRSVPIIGGMSQQKQERLLKHKPDVVIATPGRLWALMNAGLGESLDLSDMELLVVDEVDRMLEKGHFEELGRIVNWIHGEAADGEFEPPPTEPPAKKKRKHAKKPTAPTLKMGLQTLVFSATLTFTRSTTSQSAAASESGAQSLQAKLKRMVAAMRVRPSRVVVDLTAETQKRTPELLREYRMHCANLLQKDTNLYYLVMRYPGRVLVFANSVDATRRLYSLLGKLQLKPQMLHARMQEQKRLKNLDRFAERSDSVLLATDVAARGLDIKVVDCVIHYQVPRTTEIYVHRSGRTARASSEGKSVLFVDPTDMQPYQKLRRNIDRGADLQLLVPDSPTFYKACQERVRTATECESAEFAIKKATSRREWFLKAAEEAEIELDDERGDEYSSAGDEKLQGVMRTKKVAQRNLDKLLQLDLPPMAKDARSEETATSTTEHAKKHRSTKRGRGEKRGRDEKRRHSTP